jgi:hypothetical protein
VLTVALLLVAGAAGLLVAGVVATEVALVYASIGVVLVGAVLLVVGVVRNRPRRGAEVAVAATWSGAARAADPGGAEHPSPASASRPLAGPGAVGREEADAFGEEPDDRDRG